ncbi:MAG: GAF domain-containing protein [Chloroflexota bacterium]
MNNIKLLLIETNDRDAQRVQDLLSHSARLTYEVTYDTQLIVTRDLGMYDVVLLTFSMFQNHAMDLVNSNYADTPLLLIVEPAQEEKAMQAVQAGVQDYLVKGQFDLHSAERAIKLAIERFHWMRNTIKLSLIQPETVPTHSQNTLVWPLERNFVTAHGSDLAEHKLIEQALRDSEAAEREQRTLAEALRDTAALLTSSLDIDIVMNRILDNVGKVVPHDVADIIMLEGDKVRTVYSHGQNPPSTEMIRKTYRQMIETGQPCLIGDTADSPFWMQSREQGADWIRSYLGVPISTYGNVIGFLNLDSATPNFFTPLHAERLKAFADQAAIAIQNARLFDKVSRNADEMATLYRATSFLYTSLTQTRDLVEMCDQIARTVVREFGKIDCGVLLVKEDGSLLRIARAGDYQMFMKIPLWVEGPGLVAECIRTGQIIYTPDVNHDPRYISGDARTRSELVLPLRAANGVIGALDIQSTETDAFQAPNRRLLEAFAERASAAIANVQLYEKNLQYTDMLAQRVLDRTATLEAERSQLKAILNSMTEGVMYWEYEHGERVVKYVNDGFCRMVGYSQSEIVNQINIFYDLLAPDSESEGDLPKDMQDILEAQGHWQAYSKILRKDSTTFDAHIIVTLVKNADGEAHSGVSLMRDISQEKALQEQKDRFIANASHELRTPISNLKVHLYLLGKQPHLLSDHMRVLNQVANRMQSLVEDLLDVSRFEQGVFQLERKVVILQDLIGDVVMVQQSYAEQKGIRVRSDMPIVPMLIYLDGDRIAQVITNLVVNAINYTPEGGTVDIELSMEQAANGPCSVIRVRDTGIGIAADLVQHIFEPFFRANMGTVRGTGLGLTISQEIIKLHGGEISVQSEKNVGTTFTIQLPIIYLD